MNAEVKTLAIRTLVLSWRPHLSLCRNKEPETNFELHPSPVR